MKILSRIYTGLIFIFLYAPIAVLIIFSFNQSKSRSILKGFSLRWYENLFRDSTILEALRTSIEVAVIAAVVSTIIGTAARTRIRNNSYKLPCTTRRRRAETQTVPSSIRWPEVSVESTEVPKYLNLISLEAGCGLSFPAWMSFQLLYAAIGLISFPCAWQVSSCEKHTTKTVQKTGPGMKNKNRYFTAGRIIGITIRHFG